MPVTKKTILAALALLLAIVLGVFIGRRLDAVNPTLSAAAGAAHLDADKQISIRRAEHAQGHARASIARTPSAAPLPPPGTPLKQTLAELEARAESGDAEAASRLYRDLRRCDRARKSAFEARTLAMLAMDNKNGKLSAEDAQRQQRLLGIADQQLSFARDNAELCNGLDDQQLEMVVPSTLRAGQLGDTSAAACYVGSMLSFQPGLLDHPEWLTDYKQNALALAAYAVDHGDWTTVKLLASSYQSMFYGEQLSQVTGSDPAQAYKYLRLWRLGAPLGANTGRLDAELEQIAGELSADAISAGDNWARATWQKSFAANPQTSPSGNINICDEADR